ncbi:MAG TPA: DUF503 domain-containing protein [Candidatus Omnitrophota bacterium]|nr:DUF503 domain-containing protein [Candidatus Omnitrophota bacterium]HPD85672.1 DUF503 domain-containing protein [Candidatus Omnitrophota bacterium]HRZ04515.1 DUF503 domain-containing protein [Candidatus Omnitrophota bacterium]
MIDECTHHIGVLYVSLYMPLPQSLKEKRTILKSLKDRVRLKFNVSIAEIGGQDKWQVATLGIAMIGNDQRYVDSCLSNIISFIESMGQVQISDHQISFF